MNEMIVSAKIWLKEARVYALHLFLLVVFWAVVPAFAKLGQFDGIQKTFWINIFAAATLLILVPVLAKWRNVDFFKKRKIERVDIAKMSVLGVIFPFLYNLCYFEAIYEGSPTLTQMMTRAAPFVYAMVYVHVLGNKGALKARDLWVMVITMGAVLIALSGGVNQTQITTLSILLASFSVVFMGTNTAFIEAWRDDYHPLIITLIGEVITAILATILVITTNEFVVPTGDTLYYLIVIGVLANAIGFWLFNEGFQNASGIKRGNEEVVSHKVIFLIFQSGLLTFVQVVVVALLAAETITKSFWMGVLVLTGGLLWYAVAKGREKKTA